jgi:hypothetical protein
LLFFINDERHPVCETGERRCRRQQATTANCALGLACCVIRIGNQRKIQYVFAGALLMRRFILCGNAAHCCAFRNNVPISIVQRTRLRRAAGRIIFGVEIKNQSFAAIVLATDGRAVGHFFGETGRRVAGF